MQSVPPQLINERPPRWGRAPVALVPQAIRVLEAGSRAPASLEACCGEPLTLAELGPEFWQRCSDIDKRCLTDIVKLLGPMLSRHADAMIEPRETMGRISLAAMPLSAPTAKALRAYFEEESIDCRELSFGQLLAVPNVGVRRAIEFSCLVEIMGEPSGQRSSKTPNFARFFALLARWAAHERHELTLQGVLPAPPDDWPETVTGLWEEIRSTDIGSLAAPESGSESAAALLLRCIAQCSTLTLTILRARVLAMSEPTRLEVLSAALGETPMRIIELEQKGLEVLGQLRTSAYSVVSHRADAVRHALGAAIPCEDHRVAETLKSAAAEFESAMDSELAIELLLWLAGPYQKHDGWLLTGANPVGRTAELIHEHRTTPEPMRSAELEQALSEIGILPDYHDQWLRWVDSIAWLIELEGERHIAARDGEAVFAVK